MAETLTISGPGTGNKPRVGLPYFSCSLASCLLTFFPREILELVQSVTAEKQGFYWGKDASGGRGDALSRLHGAIGKSHLRVILV